MKVYNRICGIISIKQLSIVLTLICCLTLFWCDSKDDNSNSPYIINNDYPALIFHLDESTNNLAHDDGDFKVVGEITGGATWVDGIAGSGLSFENPDSQLQLWLEKKGLNATKMTVEAWIKPLSLEYDTTNIIVGGSFSWMLILSNGYLEFWVKDGNGSSSWVKLLAWDTLLENDIWYYIGLLFNGSEVLLYVNGEVVASSSGIYYIDFWDEEEYFIGGSSWCCQFDDYIDSFPGIIDEISIVFGMLTNEQINHNFENKTSGDTSLMNRSSILLPMTDPDVLPNTIALFHMDEGSGSQTRDRLDRTLNGKISGGALWAEGVSGNAISFDNKNARILRRMELDGIDAFTAELWVKASDLVFEDTALLIGSSFSWKIQLRENKLEFLIIGFSDWGLLLDWDVDFIDDQWHYLAVTYNGSEAKLYIDGVNVRTTPCIYQIKNFGDLSIGGSTGCCYFDDYIDSFPGLIDEVRLSSRELTSEEINNRYNSFTTE